MEKDLARFSLQFFADNEKENEVEEIEENQEETSEIETEEEEVFQDDEETTDDVEEKVEEKSELHTEGEKKQSKQVNEYFKKLRLSQKKNEKPTDLSYEQGRIKGILEAVNNTNPYTNEKIEDNEDIQEFLIMKQMKEKGLDPVEDYSKYLKKLAREDRASKGKKADEAVFIQNDLKTFTERYPNKKLDEVMQDENFIAFASVSLGKVPIADLYDNYEKFMSNAKTQNAKEIETQINKSKARKKSSSGALGTSNGQKPIDYANLSDTELEKMIARAKAGQLSKKFR